MTLKTRDTAVKRPPCTSGCLPPILPSFLEPPPQTDSSTRPLDHAGTKSRASWASEHSAHKDCGGNEKLCALKPWVPTPAHGLQKSVCAC
eukprot:4381772-Amphidinium_carterae.1